MFSLICSWINGWVNKGGAGNLRRHRAHFDVIVMKVITILIGDVLGSSNDPRKNLSSQITTQIWLSFSLIREFCSRRVCLIQIFYMLHASKNVKRCMWKKSWRCEHSHFEYMYIYESLINVVANCGLVWMLWMERRLHCMECVKLICKCREYMKALHFSLTKPLMIGKWLLCDIIGILRGYAIRSSRRPREVSGRWADPYRTTTQYSLQQ